MVRRNQFLKFVLAAGALSLLSAGCEVKLKDMGEDDERETVEMESWSNGPGSSTYSFVKCSSAEGKNLNPLYSVCGTRLNDSSGQSYNWQTNCVGSSCGSVSVFAHYMLNDDLGQQGTLHIEAFDNAQFANAPVSSLEIQGFDASKPTSSKLEEIFLAPGEYYFRAYIAPAGTTPIPYSLQGLELVSETPVGILGALSGAERVLVKNAAAASDTVHIYINQLFKKPVPAEDSFAKIRLELSLKEDLKADVEKYRDVHVLLLKEADLELKPAYDFTLSTTNLLVDTPATYFVSPSVEPASYYVFAFIDANGNRYFDENEVGAYVSEADGKPSLVSIEKDRTKALKLGLE